MKASQDESRPARRLAAILSTDAAGYSRLMAEDDVATHSLMKARRVIIRALVLEHGGRVVDAVGDNLLAEFASVVDSVMCAIEVQRRIELANRELGPDRGLSFRIGINIGDVLVEGDSLIGQGVNIAARLESAAPVGGICVSAAAFDQLGGRVKAEFEDVGELEFKNISSPIRAYHVFPQAQQDAAAEFSLTVPGFAERPAVAVLAFESTSDDPDQRHFACGISDELIACLAGCRFLPVVDRNSSFVYRDRSVDLRKVGRELGVRYVVTGSVRMSGEQVRVLSQLVDATTSREAWSARYTREFDDVFALQDEIAEAIIAAIEPALVRAERDRVRKRPPADLNAWDFTMRALSHVYAQTREDNEIARSLALRATVMDTQFSPPLTVLAVTHLYDLLHQWSPSPAKSLEMSYEAAAKSLALDDTNPIAISAMGFVLALRGSLGRAAGSLERALELNPSLALAYYGLGIIAQLRGKSDEAIAMLAKAIRLSPQDPMLRSYRAQLAQAYFGAEAWREAATWAERSLELGPEPDALRVLAASCGYLNEATRALDALDQLSQVQPEFSLETLGATISPGLADRLLAGWRLAGWKG